MESLIATCWRPDRGDRARSVHDSALTAMTALSPGDSSESVAAEGVLITRVADTARSEAAPHTDVVNGLTVAHAGWVGLWNGSSGRRIGNRDLAVEYAQRGRAVFDDLYGQYALIAARPGSLAASSDHAGFFPLYFAEESGIVWVSSSAVALARALNRRVRPRTAMALFLSARVRAPDSAFEGVRRLGYGEILSVDDGVSRLDHTWSPFRSPVEYRDIRDCASQGAAVLAAVCSSVESGARPVNDLTGGLDSRLVASCSPHGDDRLQVTVSGATDDPDVVLAQGICSSLGWDCRHLPIPNWDPAERWEYFTRAVLLNDGELGGHEGDAPLLGKTELARSFDLSVTGGMGEILRDFFWRQQLTGLGRPELDVERVFRYRFSSRFTDPPAGLFEDDATDAYIADEIAAATRVANQGGSDRPNTAKLDAIYVWKMSGHVGRYLGSSNSALTNVAPIGTRPMLEFALSVPYRYRLRGKLVRHMIADRSADIASLPTDTGGSARPFSVSNPDLYVKYGLDFLNRGTRKAKALAVRRGVLPKPRVSSTPDAEAFRRHMCDAGLLDPAALSSAGLYRAEGLERFLTAARRPDAVEPAALYALASVETTCRAVDCGVGAA
jgi:hypothetical protein